MQAAFANCVPATRCWKLACEVCAAVTVMFTLEKLVPGGYVTVRLCGPKLNVFGAVGLSGCVIDCELGGADGIRIPNGVVIGIVATTAFVEVWMTDSVLSAKFP